jgi:hypothetical protein
MDILLVKILEEPISRVVLLGVLAWVSFWVAYRVGRWAEQIVHTSKNTWDEFFLNGPMVSEDFMDDRL